MADFEIKGMAELQVRLDSLPVKTSVSVMRSAMRVALRPTVLKMIAMAPKGTRAHKTHKGRWVPPGFLSRSVKYVTGVDRRRGVVIGRIGVASEAWYGVQIFDQGPRTITKRRYAIKGGRRLRGKAKRTTRQVKPYTLQKVPWFSDVFKADAPAIANRFADYIRKRLDKLDGR